MAAKRRKKRPGRPKGKWEYLVQSIVPHGKRHIIRDEAVTSTLAKARKAARHVKLRHQPTVSIRKYRVD